MFYLVGYRVASNFCLKHPSARWQSLSHSCKNHIGCRGSAIVYTEFIVSWEMLYEYNIISHIGCSLLHTSFSLLDMSCGKGDL